MFNNYANKSLFSVVFPDKPDFRFKFKSAAYQEFISKTGQLTLLLESFDEIPPTGILNQLIEFSWDWKGKVHLFRGIVAALTFKPSGLRGTECCLVCEPPLLPLKRIQQSRHFIYKNLQTIIKVIIAPHVSLIQEVKFHISGSDPERAYTEQHQETDLSFLERILHEVGWFYQLDYTQSGVLLHIYDQSSLCPLMSDSIHFQPLDQGTKTTDSIYELVYSQDESEELSAESDVLGLRSGQVFQLQGHPYVGFNKPYLITSIEHKIEEDSEKLRYRNLLRLIPSKQVFKPRYSEPERRINTVQVARIHSDTQAPHLTEKGEYLFKSPHTDELSHPVRLSTPYAGKNYGFHFPLHDHTQVLIAYLNGHPDQPVILGSLFNEEHPNVVTSHNARQNLWITQSGHTLLMDDHPGVQKILMHTPEQTQRILLDASDELQKIELVSETGQFNATVALGTNIQTEADFSLTAGQNLSMVAVKDCLFSSEKSSIQAEAAQDLTHHAGQNMKLHAEQDLNIRVDGQAQTTVKGNMRTDIKSGSYLLNIASGRSSHQAQGAIEYTSKTANIVFKTANATLSINADGSMVFNAKKIILQAGQIDIHNAGKGTGN